MFVCCCLALACLVVSCVVFDLLLVDGCSLFGVPCLLCVVCWLRFVVLLFVDCLLCVVCCLLFVGRCL